MKTIFIKTRVKWPRGQLVPPQRQTGLMEVPEDVTSDEKLYAYTRTQSSITIIPFNERLEPGESVVLNPTEFEEKWMGD